MADVFSQLYIQTVFAVKNRESLVDSEWEVELYKYTTGIIEGRGHKMLAIGGMPDHIHIFLGMKPVEPLADLVREVKKATSTFVKANRLSPFNFGWQAGYGAFSYSRSHMDRVCKYIFNQKVHHAKRTFKEEYYKMIKDFGVEVGNKKFFEFF